MRARNSARVLNGVALRAGRGVHVRNSLAMNAADVVASTDDIVRLSADAYRKTLGRFGMAVMRSLVAKSIALYDECGT